MIITLGYQVLELLAHLNKRLKARETIQLPVKKLMDQLNDQSTCSFTKVHFYFK